MHERMERPPGRNGRAGSQGERALGKFGLWERGSGLRCGRTARVLPGSRGAVRCQAAWGGRSCARGDAMLRNGREKGESGSSGSVEKGAIERAGARCGEPVRALLGVEHARHERSGHGAVVCAVAAAACGQSRVFGLQQGRNGPQAEEEDEQNGCDAPHGGFIVQENSVGNA